MKGLIVYYSYMSSNEKLAFELKNRTGFDIFKICELKKRNGLTLFFDLLFRRKAKIQSVDIDLKQYDCLILVSPIWGRKIASPMKAFLNEKKDQIDKYVFISFCDGNDKQKQKIFNELNTIIGHQPITVNQLCVSDLPEENKKRIYSSIRFKVIESDIKYFDKDINLFINSVK